MEPLLKLFGPGTGGSQSALDRATRNGVSQRDLENIPIANGVLVDTGGLPAGVETTIAHTLNRVPIGVLMGIPTAATGVYPIVGLRGTSRANITLEASAAVDGLVVWVF